MKIQIITRDQNLKDIATEANGLANAYNHAESGKLISAIIFGALTSISGIIQATFFADDLLKNKYSQRIFGLVNVGLPVISGIAYGSIRTYQGTLETKIKGLIIANPGLIVISDIPGLSIINTNNDITQMHAIPAMVPALPPLSSLTAAGDGEK